MQNPAYPTHYPEHLVRVMQSRLRLLEPAPKHMPRPANWPAYRGQSVFFGHQSMKLGLIAHYGTETMSTDSLVIRYNPDYLKTITDEICDCLIAHETLHCSLGHHARRGNRDPLLWNISCDYAVNWILVQAGFTLWPGALYDPRFAGMHAERIYAILMAEYQRAASNPEPGMGKPSKSSGNPDQPGNSPDQPGDEEDDSGEPGYGDDDGNDEDGDEPSDPEEGDGHGDEPEPEPDPDHKPWHDLPKQPGEVHDLPPDKRSGAKEATPAEKAASVRDWQIAAEQAMAMARGCGSVGMDCARSLTKVKQPTVDWESALRRFFAPLVPQDETWEKPNRRYIGSDLYLPSIRKEGMGELVIFWDTSGSITDGVGASFAAEIISIIEEIKPSIVTVIYCDTSIRKVQRFERGETVRISSFTPRGGGGTSFRPPFIWVSNHAMDCNPVCGIYLTDMQSDEFPHAAPDYPFLWVSILPNQHAPWGELLYADIDPYQ